LVDVCGGRSAGTLSVQERVWFDQAGATAIAAAAAVPAFMREQHFPRPTVPGRGDQVAGL
jgi:hypothetical protein